jgi:predicted metal-dependent hydrolase
LQGLIQVTAAFHHLRRNNPVGTGRLLHAALRRLELYPACFGGISVTTLCSDIRKLIQELHAEEPMRTLARARILPVVHDLRA